MRLMEYLPEKYGNSPETVAIQAAIQREADALWTARDEQLRQLNPRTADGWGLKLWEDAMGLLPAAGGTLEQRRSRIVAKIRGMGTVTAELLKAVVESFLTTRVEVVEHPRDNWVEICFSAEDEAYPPDELEMLEAVLEILPAHLGIKLILRTYHTVRNGLQINFGGAVGTGYVLRPQDVHITATDCQRSAGGALYYTRVTSKLIE